MKNNPPEKIFLQWYGDGSPDELGDVCVSEVTHSLSRVFDGDIVYVRADLMTKKRKRKTISRKDHHV